MNLKVGGVWMLIPMLLGFIMMGAGLGVLVAPAQASDVRVVTTVVNGGVQTVYSPTVVTATVTGTDTRTLTVVSTVTGTPYTTTITQPTWYTIVSTVNGTPTTSTLTVTAPGQTFTSTSYLTTIQTTTSTTTSTATQVITTERIMIVPTVVTETIERYGTTMLTETRTEYRTITQPITTTVSVSGWKVIVAQNVINPSTLAVWVFNPMTDVILRGGWVTVITNARSQTLGFDGDIGILLRPGWNGAMAFNSLSTTAGDRVWVTVNIPKGPFPPYAGENPVSGIVYDSNGFSITVGQPYPNNMPPDVINWNQSQLSLSVAGDGGGVKLAGTVLFIGGLVIAVSPFAILPLFARRRI